MSSIDAARIDAKIRGWDWVTAEIRRIRAECVAECERLLGPVRGE